MTRNWTLVLERGKEEDEIRLALQEVELHLHHPLPPPPHHHQAATWSRLLLSVILIKVCKRFLAQFFIL